MTRQPIFIIGTQRSGSNLLRLILDQSEHIDAPHPPHLLQHFMPLESRYGDLGDDANFHMLASDMVGYVNSNPVPWPRQFSVDEVADNCRAHSVIAVMERLYVLSAQCSGADVWCNKSMANVHYIAQLEQEGLRPHYIHLYRDGRDVAASFLKCPVGEKHVYFIAQQWAEEQELALHWKKTLGEERVSTIVYEELVASPRAVLEPILAKSGIPWGEGLLEYYRSQHARLTADAGQMWKNVVTPVDRSRASRYRERLSAAQIAIFEAVAGKTLVRLGYQTDTDIEAAQPFSADTIAQFAQQNSDLKKQARITFQDDFLLRAPQENLLRAIRERLAVVPSSR
jgi:hypothetical protein